MSTPEERRSLFRVVSGTPTDDEIAALTVVLAAVTAAPADDAPQPLSRWNDRAAAVRRQVAIGGGAWRASAWPR